MPVVQASPDGQSLAESSGGIGIIIIRQTCE
jgi:hypothetical protein